MRKHLRSPGVRSAPLRVKAAPFRVAVERKADAELLTSEYRMWRAAVLRNAGFRCEWVEGGQRCERTSPDHRLFADHVTERRDQGAVLDPRNGQALCGKHHTRKTLQARARRFRL